MSETESKKLQEESMRRYEEEKERDKKLKELARDQGLLTSKGFFNMDFLPDWAKVGGPYASPEEDGDPQDGRIRIDKLESIDYKSAYHHLEKGFGTGYPLGITLEQFEEKSHKAIEIISHDPDWSGLLRGPYFPIILPGVGFIKSPHRFHSNKKIERNDWFGGNWLDKHGYDRVPEDYTAPGAILAKYLHALSHSLDLVKNFHWEQSCETLFASYASTCGKLAYTLRFYSRVGILFPSVLQGFNDDGIRWMKRQLDPLPNEEHLQKEWFPGREESRHGNKVFQLSSFEVPLAIAMYPQQLRAPMVPDIYMHFGNNLKVRYKCQQTVQNGRTEPLKVSAGTEDTFYNMTFTVCGSIEPFVHWWASYIPRTTGIFVCF